MTTPVLTVGQGEYTYEVDKHWGRGPNGLPEFGMVSGVDRGFPGPRVSVIRTPVAEVLVFHPNGTLLTWGRFVEPHMLFFTATRSTPPISPRTPSRAGPSTANCSTPGAHQDTRARPARRSTARHAPVSPPMARCTFPTVTDNSACTASAPTGR